MLVEKSFHTGESCGNSGDDTHCIICIQQSKQECGGIGLWKWRWCRGNLIVSLLCWRNMRCCSTGP